MIGLPTFRGLLGGFNPLAFAPSPWLSDTGSSAATWPDISGNSMDATQGTGSAQPAIITNAINGKQVRRFDGNDSFAFPSGLPTGATARTFFVVGSQANSTGVKAFLYYGGTADRSRFGIRWNNDTVQAEFANGSLTTPAITSPTAPKIVCVTYPGGNFSGSSIRVNGAAQSLTQVGTDAPLATTDTNRSIGVRVSDGFAYLAGDIAEVITYPSLLSIEKITMIETYLKAKYAL